MPTIGAISIDEGYFSFKGERQIDNVTEGSFTFRNHSSSKDLKTGYFFFVNIATRKDLLPYTYCWFSFENNSSIKSTNETWFSFQCPPKKDPDIISGNLWLITFVILTVVLVCGFTYIGYVWQKRSRLR
jgi:hypothetical protein